MRQIIILTAALALAGCMQLPGAKSRTGAPNVPAAPAPITATALPPPTGATSADTLDTTTPEQKRQALAIPVKAAPKKLGETVASLGAPADPGFWLRTPLVSAKSQGRVELNGKSIAVELRPGNGPKGGGSQLSLAAFRALGLGLTDLPKVTVYGQ